MNCPKCNTPNMEDSLFCRACGASLAGQTSNQNTNEADMDKTMSIPMVKGDMDETVSIPVVREKAPKPAPERHNYVSMPAPQPKGSKKTNKKEKILTFVIAFLATLILGLCITLAVILLGGKESVPKDIVQPEETPVAEEVKKEEIPEEEEKTEGESIGMENTAESGIKIDRGFAFAQGVEIKSTAIDYKMLSGTDYVCDVPSVFQFVSDNGEEIRYAAEDKTAYMDIGIAANTLSAGEIMDKTASELGGSVRHKERGEDYFAMSIESDGVIYYQKCYVGEYITYMEVVYPSEYDGVYSVYIADMEKSFEKK